MISPQMYNPSNAQDDGNGRKTFPYKLPAYAVEAYDYIITPGETFYTIAERLFGVNTNLWTILLDINPTRRQEDFIAGMSIKLPTSVVELTAQKVPATDANKTLAKTTKKWVNTKPEFPINPPAPPTGSLVVTKVSDKAEYVVGERIMFTITVVNTLGVDISVWELTDVIPKTHVGYIGTTPVATTLPTGVSWSDEPIKGDGTIYIFKIQCIAETIGTDIENTATFKRIGTSLTYEDTCVFDIVAAPTPAAPTSTNTTFEVCVGAASPDYYSGIVGTNIKYYTTSTGGTGVTTPPLIDTSGASTVHMYVTQTVNGTESSTRLHITINVRAIPDVIGAMPSYAVLPTTIDLTNWTDANGSLGTVTYKKWDGTGWNINITALDAETISETGWYQIKKTNPAGCSDVLEIYLTVDPEPVNIVGCMDVTALNYNPLATVSDPSMCVYAPPSHNPRIILYPFLEAIELAGAPPTTLNYWNWDMVAHADFVHLHPLNSLAYPMPNDFYVGKYDGIIIGATYPTLNALVTRPPSAKRETYRYDPYYSAVWMWIVNSNNSFLFQDTAGNQAVCMPTLALRGDAAQPIVCLPTITVEKVSESGGIVTVRITRGHTSVPSYINYDLAWTTGTSGSYADPADPLNSNKILMDLAVGTRKDIVVTAGYTTTMDGLTDTYSTYEPGQSRIEIIFDII